MKPMNFRHKIKKVEFRESGFIEYKTAIGPMEQNSFMFKLVPGIYAPIFHVQSYNSCLQFMQKFIKKFMQKFMQEFMQKFMQKARIQKTKFDNKLVFIL